MTESVSTGQTENELISLARLSKALGPVDRRRPSHKRTRPEEGLAMHQQTPTFTVLIFGSHQ